MSTGTVDNGGWWGQAAADLFDHLEDRFAVMRFDDDGQLVVVRINRALAHSIGYDDPQQAAGRMAYDVYPPEAVDEIIGHLDVARRTGRPFSYEAVRELPTGRQIISATVIAIDERTFVGFGRDVSEERETARRVRELERLADIGTWWFNLDDGTVWWSPQLQRIYGLEPDGELRTLDDAMSVIHPDDRDRVGATVKRALDEGVTEPIEYRIVRTDGEVRTVVGRAEAVRDVDGRLVRMAGTVQDLTDVRRLQQRERKLREAVQMHDRALELNDDVVQGLSRAWLAVQLDDRQHALDALEATTRKATNIVNGLLAGTTTRAGRIRPGDLARNRPSGQDNPKT